MRSITPHLLLQLPAWLTRASSTICVWKHREKGQNTMQVNYTKQLDNNSAGEGGSAAPAASGDSGKVARRAAVVFKKMRQL